MKESIRLKKARLDDNIRNIAKLDKLQDDLYKKFKFYDGIIKAIEREEEYEKSNSGRSK